MIHARTQRNNILKDLFLCLSIERWNASQELVNDDAQCPPIYFLTMPATENHLGRQIIYTHTHAQP